MFAHASDIFIAFAKLTWCGTWLYYCCLIWILNFNYTKKLVPWESPHDLETDTALVIRRWTWQDTANVLSILKRELRCSLRKFSLISKQTGGFRENNTSTNIFDRIEKSASSTPQPKLNTLNYFRCKFQITLCTFFGDLTILTLAGRLWELTSSLFLSQPSDVCVLCSEAK